MIAPPKPVRTGCRTARGFSLISAIFLLVVLSGLGVAMVTLSTTHQVGAALDVQGARAYQAARAGIEWGLYRQLQPPTVPCFAATSFALPAGTTLSGFTVTVTCTLTTGPGTLHRWQITSTACSQPAGTPASCPNPNPGADYVQRRMQVDF